MISKTPLLRLVSGVALQRYKLRGDKTPRALIASRYAIADQRSKVDLH